MKSIWTAAAIYKDLRSERAHTRINIVDAVAAVDLHDKTRVYIEQILVKKVASQHNVVAAAETPYVDGVDLTGTHRVDRAFSRTEDWRSS